MAPPMESVIRRSRLARLALAGTAALSLAACTVPVSGSASSPQSSRFGEARFDVTSDVTLAFPPYTVVDTEWKERLDQPYVFLELLGPYEETIGFMPQLSRHLANQGIRAAGSPFALYYDDPMRVPAGQRRSRLCVPVDPSTVVGAPLGYDILPSEQVIYARVAGPYDTVSLAYPAMFDVLRERAWVLDGPIREIYQVDPSTVATFEELVTEIQMPWRPL